MSDLCPIAVIAVSSAIEDQPQTVQDANDLALKQKKYCDVIFTFPNLPDRIEAHEIFLKIRSPVFEQIFRMRKSGNVQGGEVEISECTPERFQEFLEFIYTDKFEVNAAGALDLLHLAQKYKVQPLMIKCEELLQAEISPENSIQVFETARRYGRDDLVDRTGEVMAKSFAYLVEKGALDNAQEETLIYLLKRDDLAVKEVELFDFILKWSRNQDLHAEGDGHLHDQLKNVIPLIRYTNMTPLEFSAVVLPTKLLTAEEMLSVYSYITGDEAMRKSTKLNFNTTARNQAIQDQCVLVDFYGGNEDSNPLSKSTYLLPLHVCINFQVSTLKKRSDNVLKTPAITAIKVMWPSREVTRSEMSDESLNFSVRVFDGSDVVDAENVRLRFSKHLLSCKDGDEHEILVEPPVELIQGVTYCVVVKDLADHHDFPSEDYAYNEVYYEYSEKFSPYDLCPEASVHLEGVDLELENIHKENRVTNLFPSSPYFPITVIRGIKISLV